MATSLYIQFVEHIIALLISQTGRLFGLPKKVHQPEEEPLEKIKLKHLILHFSLLCVGTTTALVIFLCEIGLAACEYEYHASVVFTLVLYR